MNNTYAKITEHKNGFSKIARAHGMCPYDGADYGRISFAPTMVGITDEYDAPLRWGGFRAMWLKIRPPVLQNVLKITLEGAFLAQGRINALPH